MGIFTLNFNYSYQHVGIACFVICCDLLNSKAVFIFLSCKCPWPRVFFKFILSFIFLTYDYDNARWMNGQYLRALPPQELTKVVGECWKSTGKVTDSGGNFVEVYASLLSYFMFLLNYEIINHHIFSKWHLVYFIGSFMIVDYIPFSFCDQEAVHLLKDGIDVITDADKAISNLWSYPLHSTLTR